MMVDVEDRRTMARACAGRDGMVHHMVCFTMVLKDKGAERLPEVQHVLVAGKVSVAAGIQSSLLRFVARSSQLRR